MGVPAAVLALKEGGKAMFLSGQYGEAAAEYGKALDRLAKEGQRESSMGVILLSNQAACYTKTGECRKAVEACDTALAIGGSDAKILLRRANANEEEGHACQEEQQARRTSCKIQNKRDKRCIKR